jgi:hypothetical protein
VTENFEERGSIEVTEKTVRLSSEEEEVKRKRFCS